MATLEKSKKKPKTFRLPLDVIEAIEEHSDRGASKTTFTQAAIELLELGLGEANRSRQAVAEVTASEPVSAEVTTSEPIVVELSSVATDPSPQPSPEPATLDPAPKVYADESSDPRPAWMADGWIFGGSAVF